MEAELSGELPVELPLVSIQTHDFYGLENYLQDYDLKLCEVECWQQAIGCPICAIMRETLLDFFPKKFTTQVKEMSLKIKQMEKSNLSKMYWPKWRTSIYNAESNYLRKILRYWNTIVFATYARILWKRWIERRLRPDSSYIHFKATQFKLLQG